MTVTRASAWSRSGPGLVVACVVLVALAGCGKKGPPLVPIVRLPAAVQRVTASRLGHDIYLTLTIPAANVDRSTPVDLSYVDVYALTGTAVPRTGFVEQATRIARIPVVPAPLPGVTTPPATPPPGAVAAGQTVTIVETVQAPANPEARRFYLAVPFSTRARPGSQHTPVEVKFASLPAPPSGAAATYTASAVSLSWVPSAEPVAAEPRPRVNVYRAMTEAETNPDAQVRQASRPAPLNGAPLETSTFTDTVTFGVETCYTLRSVVGEGATAVEGEPSARTCVTPIDRFAPAPPAQLVAIATAGAIDLLWEANAESDLGGYIVWRGVVGDARLQPLTAMPITDVRFSDKTVVSGMRYVYAVVAVDRQSPSPNVSPESARVEETAQ